MDFKEEKMERKLKYWDPGMCVREREIGTGVGDGE